MSAAQMILGGTVAVLCVLLGGCAVVYRDAKSGAVNVWGVGHLAARATVPDEGKKAIVHGVSTSGVAIGVWDGSPFITIGWNRQQTVEIVDANTAIRIEAPHGDLLQVEVGSEPPSEKAKENRR